MPEDDAASPLSAAPGGMPVGVWLRPGFLTVAECAGLCAEMDEAGHVEGGVREPDEPGTDSVDRSARRAFDCLVSDTTVRSAVERMCGLAPELAAHFEQTLTQYEEPHFVVYEPGGFYRPHRDLYPGVGVPDPLRRRRLSLVVFLNDSDDGRAEPDDRRDAGTRRYGGGVLRLCSHEADEFDARSAWDVPAARGLLVAFRADTWHEVTPVTVGKRYAIVMLLLAPEDR